MSERFFGDMQRDEKCGYGLIVTGVLAAEYGCYKFGQWAGNMAACAYENINNTAAIFGDNLRSVVERGDLQHMASSEPATAWGVVGGIAMAAAGLVTLCKTTPYWIEYPFRAGHALFGKKPSANTPD